MNDAKYLSIKIECIHFFESNPSTFEAVEDSSTRLGKAKEELEEVLVQLETLSIVEKVGLGTNVFYRYIQPVGEAL